MNSCAINILYHNTFRLLKGRYGMQLNYWRIFNVLQDYAVALSASSRLKGGGDKREAR